MMPVNLKRQIPWMRLALVLGLCTLLFSGCGSPANPIDRLKTALRDVSTYSIVLDDMKEEGNFFPQYFQRYQIITPEKTTLTDWMEVPTRFYEDHQPFLGMTIYSQKDGQAIAEAGPPGYEYVGDPKYGQWQTNSSGQSFWVFYGQYALLSRLLGGGPVYRDNYDMYRSYRSQNRPYYGPNSEYGTNGSATRVQKPDFYTRRANRLSSQKSTFGDKVNSRIGRTRTSTRSRSSGVGK